MPVNACNACNADVTPLQAAATPAQLPPLLCVWAFFVCTPSRRLSPKSLLCCVFGSAAARHTWECSWNVPGMFLECSWNVPVACLSCCPAERTNHDKYGPYVCVIYSVRSTSHRRRFITRSLSRMNPPCDIRKMQGRE
jgi:hypothetical protein